MSWIKDRIKAWLDDGLDQKSVDSIDRAVIAKLDMMGGATWSGATVTEDSALGVAAVYGSVRVLSESISQLPLHVFTRDGENAERDNDSNLAQVLDDPNSWQTPSEFWQMMSMHLALRGNAYCFKGLSSDGTVRNLRPIHPDTVSVKQNDNLSLIYEVKLRDGSTQTFPQSRIMHLRGLVQNGFMGLSPIQAFRQGVGLALRQEEFAARLFKNGVKNSGVLTHPGQLGDETLKTLKNSINENFSGADNAHKVLVLEEGMKWESISMTPEDAQFIESRKFQKTEIAAIFGVPLFLLQDTEKATTWGTGLEQLSSAFVRFTLNPWLVKIEQAIKRDLMTPEQKRTMFAKFNSNALMRGEFKERQEGLAIQRQNGVISANEWRALEDRNPIPDGDDYTPSANLFGLPQDA